MKKQPTLYTNPCFMGAKQWAFECYLTKLGISIGCRSIDESATQYLNEHINWLWEQFLKRGIH